MKAPIGWLKEFVAIRMSPEQLAHRLTMAGLEVTGIERANGEPVLDFEITPNRADCLSIIGIAREVAALTGQRIKLPSLKSPRRQSTVHSPQSSTKLTIHIEDKRGCRRYLGRLIDGVRLGPSPAWMQRRLAACGLRPINNVVDITNYVLLEWGQPLHAFDFETLGGGTLVVRRARANEKMVAIDGTDCTLSPEMLVIADATRPVAVAGVMGGRDTQVHEHTRRILLESAWFDPLVVRRTARALGLSSESSYRFERGVDPVGVAQASQRASDLLAELAGGHEADSRDVGERTARTVTVALDPARVQRWLGTPIPPANIRQTLTGLGFAVRSGKASWRVSVPSFRRDVQQDVDLMEEIARLIGYERLPDSMPSAALAAAQTDERSYRFTQTLRTVCAGLGLTEIMTWALVSQGDLEHIHGGFPEFIPLANPLSQDHAILRPSLLPGMLRAVATNLSQGAHGVRLFELGNAFSASPAPRERLHAAVGIAGSWERHWHGSQTADLYRLKGVIEELVARLTRKPLDAKTASIAWAEPGQAMQLGISDQPLGAIGQVARRIGEAWDLKQEVWFAELDMEILRAQRASPTIARPSSPFPPVKRDLSFLVDKQAEYAKVLECIRTTGAPLASRIELIDRYTNLPQMPNTHHSLTVSIEYRDPARTLTAEEVDVVHRRIGEALVKQFGARLR